MAPQTKIVVESWQLDDLFILCVLSLASQEKESWRGGTVKKNFPLKAGFINWLLCFSTTGGIWLSVHKTQGLESHTLLIDLIANTFLTYEHKDFYFNCLWTYIFILSYIQNTSFQCLISITPMSFPFLALKNLKTLLLSEILHRNGFPYLGS